jgi:hypothetical protein
MEAKDWKESFMGRTPGAGLPVVTTGTSLPCVLDKFDELRLLQPVCPMITGLSHDPGSVPVLHGKPARKGRCRKMVQFNHV